MLLTEEEALRMVCPLSYAGSAMVGCASKRCPVWRWAHPTVKVLIAPNPNAVTEGEAGLRPEDVGADWEFVPYGNLADSYAAFWRKTTPSDKGYCGLGGKP